MSTSAERLQPGPDHPITIEPTAEPVTVTVGGAVVARTDRALTLREASYDPVQYLPLADVDPYVLQESGSTTYCPYKGEARYWSLVVGGSEQTDAVWAYDQPYPAVAAIADHVAFWPGRAEVRVGAGA